jgi:multiple sugar transport system substrate-binding protein
MRWALLPQRGRDGGGGGGGGSGSKELTVGSNASDAVPKKASEQVFANFQKASGITPKVNTVEHETYQEQINNYLQGRPDDVWMWFAGYRMQFFAQRGLAGDVSDVWQKVGGNFTPALKDASTGLDGKQYFIPFYYYPWAFFYRKSVFEENGYQPAKTWDELIALAKQMKGDGLTLAFADKDGWPAMGTFDYLNMRLNGYDFHINLMGGKEAWTDPRVAKVFDTWRELLPYSQEGALGRTWQEAAQSLAQKKSGMYLLGMFVGQQVPEADRDDLALQKKAVDLIGSAAHISQFLDRDTRPDFASTVMIPSLQEFIRKPDDVAGLTTKIENQKKTIFTS